MPSRDAVRSALVSNRAYLAKVDAGTVTQADHAAQIARLTRQVQVLIRMFVYTDVMDDVEEP